MRRASRALLLLLLVATLTPRNGYPRQPQAGVESDAAMRHVLQEALAVARETDDDRERAEGLLHLIPLLEKYDPQTAPAVIKEAESSFVKLREGHGFWTSVFEGIGRGVFIGAPLAAVVQQAHDDRIKQQDLAKKAEIGRGLVQVLAVREPVRALDIAVSLQDPFSKAFAVEHALRTSPAGADATSGKVQLLLSEARKHRSAPLLGGVAAGIGQRNPMLARELAGEALRLLHQQGYERGAPAASYVYAACERSAPGTVAALLDSGARPSKDDKWDLLTLARALVDVNASLAFRAIQLAGCEDKYCATAVSILRTLTPSLPRERHGEVLEYVRALQEQERADLMIVSDAIVSLVPIDPGKAEEYALDSHFPGAWKVAAFLIDNLIRPRRGTERQFRDDFIVSVVRLDVAVELLSTEPLRAFRTIESFDDRFWTSLAKGAWKLIPRKERPHLASLITRLKARWASSAAVAAERHPSDVARTLHRMAHVAELLDAEAVERLPDSDDEYYRWRWIDYLPLASAGIVGLGSSEPAVADRALTKSVSLTRELPDDARNWALAWNVVAWQALQTPSAKAAVRDALAHLRSDTDYGPWEARLPQLVAQVARVDASVAYAIARKADKKLRLASLLALLSVMEDASSAPVTR
jgi:hypothetical protein